MVVLNSLLTQSESPKAITYQVMILVYWRKIEVDGRCRKKHSDIWRV